MHIVILNENSDPHKTALEESMGRLVGQLESRNHTVALFTLRNIVWGY